MVNFALGFLCACGLIATVSYIGGHSSPPKDSGGSSESSAEGSPGFLKKITTSRPDNRKARMYSTDKFRREMEESLNKR